MPIEKLSIVDQIEIDSLGNVSVRIKLLVVEGDNVLGTKYHRTAIPADVPVVLQMAAVNTHLAGMGEAPVAASDIARLDAHHILDSQLPGRKDVADKLFRKPGKPVA